MFLRALDAIAAVLLYGSLMLIALVLAFPFVWFVFGAPWTGLILAVLLGLFACWFARGLLGDVERAIDRALGRPAAEDDR